MAMQSGFIKRIRDIMRMDAGINGDAQRIEQMVWMLFLKVYDAKEDDWELNEDNYESIIPEDLRWRNWAKADSNGHAMTGDKLLNFVNNTLFPVLKGNDVKEGDTIVYEGIKVTPDTPIKKAIVKSTFEDANNYMKDGVYLRQVIDVIDEIEFDDVKESHAFGFVYEEILRELQSAGSSGEFYTPRAVTEFMALMIKPKLGEKMADFACGTGGFITSWLGQLSKQVTDTSAQKQLDDSIYGIEKKPFPYLLCVTNMLLHDIEIPKIYHMNSLKHNLLDYTDADKFDVILMNPPYGGHEDKSIQGFFPDDLASSETADLFMSVILYRLKKNGRAAVIVPDGFLFGLDNAKVAVAQSDTVNGVGIAATGGRVDDGVHVAVVPADSIDGGLLTVEVAGGGPNAGLVVEGSLLASIEEHAGDLGLGGISLDEDILGEVVAHDVVDLIILITVDLVEAGNRLEGIRAGSGVITGADQVHSVGVGNKAAGDLGVLVNSQVLAVEILVSGGSAGTTDLNSLDSAVSLSAELEHIVVQDLSAGLVGTGVLIDIVVDVEVARGRGAVGIAGHDLKGSGVVGQFAALSDIRSVAVLGGSTIVDEGADVENGGDAVHVGHVSSGNPVPSAVLPAHQMRLMTP